MAITEVFIQVTDVPLSLHGQSAGLVQKAQGKGPTEDARPQGGTYLCPPVLERPGETRRRRRRRKETGDERARGGSRQKGQVQRWEVGPRGRKGGPHTWTQRGLQPLFGTDRQGILLHPATLHTHTHAHTHTHTHTGTPAHMLTTVCAHTTNLDEVLIDPLGEGFLLHTVPLIWERQGQVTWAWEKPRKPQEVTAMQTQWRCH